MTPFLCASCGTPVTDTFIDLGQMPSANAFLAEADLGHPEPRWPLRAAVCAHCLLVQLDHRLDPGRLFNSYVYFSSYSDSWVEHARRYAQEVRQRFGLGPGSQVIEVASNDGYMLRHFKDAGIPSLGVEPAANVAQAAQALGIETRTRFFDAVFAAELVQEGRSADLVIANNVLAHVPGINEFVAGFYTILKPDGVLTVEFPHLLQLIQNSEFDTIYHEHFFYYSLLAVEPLFARHGLRVFDVEQLKTHGGSLRVYASRAESTAHAPHPCVEELRASEKASRLDQMSTYLSFEKKVEACRAEALKFFANCREARRRIIGYGAAAKGNTFLNYCGIGREELLFVVDRNPAKQGNYLPGSHIPVRPLDAIFEAKPDYVVILPWNLSNEIVRNLEGIRSWGGRFVTMIPRLMVIP